MIFSLTQITSLDPSSRREEKSLKVSLLEEGLREVTD